MPVKNFKPTSPGRRQLKTPAYSDLTPGARPFKRLLKKVQAKSGRNNRGVITSQHQGGGHPKMYRAVDFHQDKWNIPGRVATVEYDPYRSAFIALIVYKDGDRRYVLSPNGMKPGAEIITAETTDPKLGNRMPLKNIPVGTLVHNIELRRGGGGKLARSAGAYGEVLAHDAGYSDIRLNSKEVRKVPSECLATVGQLSNIDYNLQNLGKAGRSRWLGIRPKVRGTAMNPVDHPYGGGEGRQPRGTRRPKTRFGKVTGGHKTRRPKKWSNHLIVQSRRVAKKTS